MKRSRIFSILYGALIVLFMAGVGVSLLGGRLSMHDHAEYEEVLEEIYTVEEIDSVLVDERSDLIYVCYSAGSYVNVYRQDGSFRWAVSAPYLRNTYFEIKDGRLILYKNDAYVYDALTGEFVEQTTDEILGLSYDWEAEDLPADDPVPGDILYDAYQVYRVEEDGSTVAIVERPAWYLLFHSALHFTVTTLAAGGILLLLFIRAWMNAKEKDTPTNRQKMSKIGRVFRKYAMVTSIVHVVYTVANIAVAFVGGYLVIGIIPLALHFIISSIVFANLQRKESDGEEAIQAKLSVTELFTFIAAFASVIIASAIAG
jgi:hypothetical protein